jgi:26S proteasome regulatory subunit N10
MTRAGTRGVQVASLALKHRQNKHQRQRIIIFVGSPLKEDQKELVKLGKKLKKNDVAVDVINFGETAENQEKLEAFIGAVNKNENSSLLTVPPGPHILSDIIISSSICNSDGDGGGGGGMGAGSFDVGGGGGAGGFDADLEMALRISAEEERQRQEREAARIAGEGGATAPAEGGATATATTAAAMGAAMADDDDDMLQQALAMSMAESQQNPAATTPKSEVPASASKAADAMEEDGDEELKLAMAMSQGAAGGDASGGMNGLLQDAGFLNDVLSSLPGVDTSDPRVQGVLDGMKDEKKEEKKEDSK